MQLKQLNFAICIYHIISNANTPNGGTQTDVLVLQDIMFKRICFLTSIGSTVHHDYTVALVSLCEVLISVSDEDIMWLVSKTVMESLD